MNDVAKLLTSDNERLEKRISELIKERDAYNARRKEAIETVEEWRNKYHKMKTLFEEVLIKHVPLSELRDFYRNQI